MDYKKFVESFSRVACVLSVDLRKNDSDNRYLIVEANEAYKHTVVQNTDDVIKAMQTADARMYEIKAEYYTRHPEMDWHNNPV